MVNEVHYNTGVLENTFLNRVNEGGTGFPNADLIMMEVNYAAQVTPWLNLMPNLQYIVNPDGRGGLGTPVSNLGNSFVVGFQLSIDLPGLFGIPNKAS
jgi:carbohydrate-selective porin OprB